MTMEDLIKKNRSRRRFFEDERISTEFLRGLIGLARLCASAGNFQPLRYVISNGPDKNRLIFPHLKWAGYLKEWPGPKEGERPSAYILVLGDLNVTKNFGCDHGIAAQSILLGAVEAGLGGCMLSAIDRMGLAKALNIPDEYEILLAIALGKPREAVKIEDMGPDGDVKYWRDERGVHHVPKRSLDDLILKI